MAVASHDQNFNQILAKLALESARTKLKSKSWPDRIGYLRRLDPPPSGSHHDWKGRRRTYTKSIDLIALCEYVLNFCTHNLLLDLCDELNCDLPYKSFNGVTIKE